jgi:hypothetical protein
VHGKLARAKRPGPKELLDKRNEDWLRAATIIYGLKKDIRQVDIWWARRFLRSILADPIVKKGGTTGNESNSARMYLKEMEKRWPDKEKRSKRKKPKRVKNRLVVRLIERTIRRVNRELLGLKGKSLYWQRRYNNLSISDKQWGEVRDRLMVVRMEVEKLEGEKARLYDRKYRVMNGRVK